MTVDITFNIQRMGVPAPGVAIKVRLLQPNAYLPDASVPRYDYDFATDSNGEATITVDTPGAGYSWPFSCSVDNKDTCSFPLGDDNGPTTTWRYIQENLCDLSPIPPSPDSVYMLKVDPAGAEGDVLVDNGTGQAVDSGVNIDDIGGGATEFTEDTSGGTSAVRVVGSGGDARGVGAVDLQTRHDGPHFVASGDYSHTEGRSNTASGNYSHAEGAFNTASGNYSHAEGENNTASGNNSHVGGQASNAEGDVSFAHGWRAKSNHIGALSLTDNIDEDATTTKENEALLQYTNGIRLVTRTDGVGTPTATLTIDGTDGVPASYDGEGTTAEILAMNPTSHLGESWWATDDHIKISAFSSPITGADEWQSVGLLYDALTDTYQLPATLDGQVQNIGQEIFRTAINRNGTTAPASSPEVFIAGLIDDTNPLFLEAVKAVASDVTHNVIFGINTTTAYLNEPFKLTTYGRVGGVDTSAWPVNTKLYVDPTTRGQMTATEPPINSWQVAEVLVQDAVDGVLSVNTINATDLADDHSTLFTGASFWATGDESVLGSGTFYDMLENNQGTVATATQTQTVGDDEALPLGQDWIMEAAAEDTPISVGERSAVVEQAVSSTGGSEKISMELYVTLADGTPVDSGVTGAPVGVRGVPILLRLESPILTAPTTGEVYFANLTGYLAETVVIPAGYRARACIIVEKIGTQGGNKTFTVYFGNEHATKIVGISLITSDDVANLASDSATQPTVTEALDNRDLLGSADAAQAAAIADAATKYYNQSEFSAAPTTDEPIKADGSGKLRIEGLGIGKDPTAFGIDVVAPDFSQLRLANNDTDNTRKNAYYQMRSYSNEQSDIACFIFQAINDTLAIANVGGGTGSLNAITEFKLYVAANATTPTGTLVYNSTTFGNTFYAALPTSRPMMVRVASGQSANAQEWQDSGGAAMSAIAKNGAWKPPTLADAAAENNTVYYSSDQSKLVYKDPTGTINNLY